MSQRAARFTIFASSVERYYHAHADSFEYAREGHALDQGLLRGSALEQAARRCRSREKYVSNEPGVHSSAASQRPRAKWLKHQRTIEVPKMNHTATKPTRSAAANSDLLAMRRQIFRYYGVFLLAAVVAFVIAGLQLAHASQPVVVIKMVDMPLSFEPKLVSIKTGDSVEWSNVGNEIHHATNDASIAINPGEVVTPKGVEPFDSGFLRPGETFTHTFTVPGVYQYACIVHETKGMLGEIVVK
jgi:plastocyanin